MSIESDSATISKSVSFNVGLGIKKHCAEFNVELLEYKCLSEGFIFVSVRGKLDDIIGLNEIATNYRPSVGRGSEF